MNELIRTEKSDLQNKYHSDCIPLNEASKHLGLDKRTVINHRVVPITKIGRRYYVKINDLAYFLAK